MPNAMRAGFGILSASSLPVARLITSATMKAIIKSIQTHIASIKPNILFLLFSFFYFFLRVFAENAAPSTSAIAAPKTHAIATNTNSSPPLMYYITLRFIFQERDALLWSILLVRVNGYLFACFCIASSTFLTVQWCTIGFHVMPAIF